MEDDWLNGAKQCMEYHFSLADNFDPNMASLYSDDALIQNTILNSDGSQETRVIPAPLYKSIIGAVMEKARELDDRYTYSDLEYKLEERRVRVTYQRYSHARDYKSPVSMLMGIEPHEAGLVFEELSVMEGQ